MASSSAELVVNIVTKLSGDGIQQAEKSTSKFKSGLASASKVAGAALLGIGAAAISAASAAAEDAKSQALLANSMKNAAGASKDQIATTEDWIDAQSRATGVADDELRPALATLVRATGDVTKSQAALKQAMDISAATGKPLSSVTDAMAKGFAGNTSALSRLVPGISQAALKSGDFARVMDEVAKKTGGAAAAAADTAAGRMARFKNSLGETEEAAGTVLLPALTKLTGVLVTVGQWAQDHGTMFSVIAAGVAILAGAIVTLNVALSVYNTITAVTAVVSGAAWAATLGPILLVIAAVVAVVAVVVILWKKSQTFRTIVMAVWHAISAGARAMGNVIRAVGTGIQKVADGIAAAFKRAWEKVKSAASTVFDWIKAHWKTLLIALTGPFGVAVALIVKNWDKIKAAADKVKTAIGNVIDKLKDIKVPGAVETALDKIKTAAENVVTAIQDVISWLKNIPVPHIDWPSPPSWFDKVMPGMVPPPPPAPAVVGVAARSAAPGVPTARVPAGARAGGGLTIVIQGAVDPEGTARQVRRILSGHERRVGLRVS